MRRRRVMLLGGGIVVAIVAILAWPGEREPRYKGRNLSAWLQLYQQRSTGRLTATEIDDSAHALQQIGTNALPWLLKWIRYQPNVGVLARLHKGSLRISWPLRERLGLDYWLARPERRAESAVAGFEALGAQAKPAVPALLKLHLEDSPTSVYAGAALVRLGTHSFDTLLHALADSRQSNRPAVATLIGNICLYAGTKSKLAVPVLVESLKDPDPKVACAAASALGNCLWMGHLVVPALVNSLEDHKVREAAADALADFGSAARPAIPALIAGLGDVEFATKAAETLGILAIEPQSVIGPLTVALQSTNHELRPAAARALGLFGAEARPAIPALIEMLRDPRDPQAQAAAADVLGELRLEPELVIPALTASLQSTNRWLRNLAGLSLKQFNSQPKATPAQTEKLKP